MPTTQKILLLDDEPDLLELYCEILGRLPSQPEIYTAASGTRAMALMQAHSFALLICDLSMPKMDGLQVLGIVRRKFPQLRTAVLTAVTDEQFRARAYAIGVDIYFEKPGNQQEIQLFLDCVESLLGQEAQGSFRGIQSKSLVDIIQLECLSQSSALLKVTNGTLEGKLWFESGEIIDAAVGDLVGEPAFQSILAWRTGNFELIPSAESGRARTIQKSTQCLLLESAHALDEAKAQNPIQPLNASEAPASGEAVSRLTDIARFKGVEFALAATEAEKFEAWGLDNAERVSAWTSSTLRTFRDLGESLRAGDLLDMQGVGLIHHVGLAQHQEKDLCVGFHRSLSAEQIRENMKCILAEWMS